jgi:hypothetical protein
MDRLDIDELDDAVLLEPAEEMAGGPVYASRVFLLRIVAAKNSRKRRAA